MVSKEWSELTLKSGRWRSSRVRWKTLLTTAARGTHSFAKDANEWGTQVTWATRPLYSVRSERLLMEQLDYNLLFRWFVGLNMDDAIWDGTVFTKNRERLLDGDIAEAFFQAVLRQARERNLLSDEHSTVDGTLLEAWSSVKSYQRV